MLNSDPFLLFTAGAATDMTLRVNASNVELINSADSTILASKPLSDFGGAGANGVRIVGSADDDTFTIDVSATVIPGGIFFDGEAGGDTLVGPDLAQTWNITGPDSGDIGGEEAGNAGHPNVAAFTGVENLAGGASDDTFVFGAGGSLSGRITGGPGTVTDSLDVSAIAGPLTVDLQNNTAAPALGEFSEIERCIGDNTGHILRGPDSGAAFGITATNSGTVAALEFTGFAHLEGGLGADQFDLNADVTGTIGGGAGEDTFRISISGITATLSGENGNDSLAILGTAGDDTITVAPGIIDVNGQAVSFNGMEALAVDGSDGDDDFIVPASESVTVLGGTGANTLQVLGTTAADEFTIDAVAVVLNGGGTIDYSEIAAVIVEGSDGNDTFEVTSSPQTSISVAGQGGTGDTLHLNGGNLGVILEQRRVTLEGRQPVEWDATVEQFDFQAGGVPAAPGRILNLLSAQFLAQAFQSLIGFARGVERLDEMGKALPGIGENTPFSAAAVFNGTSTAVVAAGDPADAADNTITAVAERPAVEFSAADVSAAAITLGLHSLAVGKRVRFEQGSGGNIGELADGAVFFVVEADKQSVKLAATIDGAPITFTSPTGTGHRLVPVHNFVSGQQLRYLANGPDAIGGLVSGETYFVVNADGDTFQLAAGLGQTPITPIEVQPAASGTEHRLEIVPIAGGDVSVGKAAGLADLFAALRNHFTEDYIRTQLAVGNAPTLAGLVDLLSAASNVTLAAVDPSLPGDLQLAPLVVSSFGTVTEAFQWDTTTWTPTIRFDFDLTARRTTALDLNLGEDARLLGLVDGPEEETNAAARDLVEFSADIEFSGLAVVAEVVSVGTEEYFGDLGQVTVNADVNETALAFDLAFGFLATEVENGDMSLAVGAGATFTDPSDDGRFQPDELFAGSSINTEIVEVSDAGVTRSFSSTFPLTVQPAITPAPGTPGGPFEDMSFSLVATDPFQDLPLIDFNDNQVLKDFTGVAAGDVLPMFEQLRNWFADLSGSELLDFNLPFVDDQAALGTLGRLYDFGGAFEQDVLAKLSEPASPTIDAQVARFQTAQALGILLSQILDLLDDQTDNDSADATPAYDDSNGTLRYDISWTHTIPATSDLPIDLTTIDLGPVTDVSFHAGAEFDASSAVDDDSDEIRLPDHGLTTGQELIYDSQGRPEIDGLTDGETYFARVVDENTVQLAGTAADAQAGNVLGLTAPALPGNQALRPATSVLTLDSSQSSVTFNLTVGIDLRPIGAFELAPPLPITTDARLEVPASGVLLADQTFTSILNNNFGEPFRVTVPVGSTQDNTTPADLVADVQRAIDAAVIGGASKALGFDYFKSGDTLSASVLAERQPDSGNAVLPFNLPVLAFALSLNQGGLIRVSLAAADHGDLAGLESALQEAIDEALTPTFTFQGIGISDDAITAVNHGLATGKRVAYAQGGNDDIGLEDGVEYIVVVVDRDTIRLAASLEDATAGPPVTLPLAPTGVSQHRLTLLDAARRVEVSSTAGKLQLDLDNPESGQTLALARADGSFSGGDVTATLTPDETAIVLGPTATRISALAFSRGDVDALGTPVPRDGVLDGAAHFTLFVDGTPVAVTVAPNPDNASRLARLTGTPLAGDALTSGLLSEDGFFVLSLQFADDPNIYQVNVNVGMSDARALGFNGAEISASGKLTATNLAPLDPVLAHDVSFALRVNDAPDAPKVLVLLTATQTEDNAVTPLGFVDTVSPELLLRALSALAQFELEQDVTFRLTAGSGTPVDVVVRKEWTQEAVTRFAASDETRIDADSDTITAVAGPAVEFDGADVSGDAITLGLHSLAVRHRVRFEQGSGGTIGGLTDGSVFFVVEADNQSVKLAATIDGQPITFSMPGGAGHHLVPLHNFLSGKAVLYESGGGAPIEGLQSGQTYFVVNATDTTLQLAGPGAPLALSPAAVGSSHTLSLETARVEFDGSSSSVVVDPSDTIDFGKAHGFANGQEVVYRGDGGSVGGLQDGDVLFVVNADETTLQLSRTPDGEPVALAPAGGGTAHALTVVRTTVTFDGSSDVVVSSANQTIDAPSHGLRTGDQIVYRAGAAGEVGGLTEGAALFVIAIDNDTIQLTDTRVGTVLDLLAPDTSVTFDGTDETEVDPGDTITALGHELQTGDAIVYRSGAGNAVGGLVDGNTYFVSGDDADTLRLAASLDEAGAGTAIDLTEVGSGVAHTLTLETRVVFDGSVAFVVDDASDKIDFGLAYRFVNGQQVTYRTLSGEGIGGLIDEEPLFVVNATAQTLQLSRTEGGDPIDISPAQPQHSQSSAHELSGTRDVTFDGSDAGVVNPGETISPTAGHAFVEGQRVVYRSGGGTDVGGLVDGETYFIVNATSGGFQLAASPAGAPLNLSLSPAGTSHTLTAANRTLEFDGSSSDVVSDHRLQLASHGLAENQELQYFQDGEPLGGVDDGELLFAVNVTADSFQLARAPFGTPVEITPAAGGTAHRLEAVHRLTRLANSTLGDLARALQAAIDESGATGVMAGIDGNLLTLEHATESLALSARDQQLDNLVADLNLSLALARPMLGKPVVATHDGDTISLVVARADSFGNILTNPDGSPQIDTGATLELFSSGNVANNTGLAAGGSASTDESLLDDINTALAAAELDGVFEARLVGGDTIELAALPRTDGGPDIVSLKVNTDVPEEPNRNADGLPVNELGFFDGQNDSRISGLIADIQAALDTALTSAGAAGVDVVPIGDLTGRFARIGFRPAEGSGILSLRLRAELNDPTVTNLGFREATEGGESVSPLEIARGFVDLVARGRSNRMFLDNSRLTSATIHVGGTVEARGRIGFLPVDLSGAVSIAATTDIEIVNPDDSTQPIDLETLRDRLTDAAQVTLTSTGPAQVVFTLTPVLLDIPGETGETITVSTSDWLTDDPQFTIAQSSETLGGLTDFSGLAFDDVIAALESVADYLDAFARETLPSTSGEQTNPLAGVLPFLSQNAVTLLDFAARFRDLVARLEQSPVDSVDQLLPLLTGALGLEALAALGFEDGQSGTSITAASTPISVVLDRDARFLLKVGAAAAVAVTLPAGDTRGAGGQANQSLSDLRDDLQAAINAALGSSEVTVGSAGGRLT